MSVYDIFPVKEVSGDIVTFEDGADGIPMESLSAVITPTQDLHGYANPWPAGGGNNKAKLSADNAGSNQKASAVYSDSGVTVSGTGTYGRYGWLIPVEIGKTYTLSFDGVASNDYGGGYYMRIFLGEYDGVWTSSADGYLTTITIDTTLATNTYTYTATTGTLFFGVYISTTATDGTLTVSELQLEQGSTPTAWTPYSNICPISGLTGLSVYRTGKNLIDPAKKVDTSTTTAKWYNDGTGFLLHSGQAYALSSNIGTDATYFVYIYDIGGTQLAYGKWTATYTPSADVYVYFQYYESGGANLSDAELQLELGSATTYESYSGNTYAVDWTTQAGTVYHGTVDPVTGQLTVDKAVLTLNTANVTNDTYPGWREVSGLRDITGAGLNGSVTGITDFTGATIRVNTLSTNNTIFFYKADLGLTATELQANMPNTDVHFLLQLATPITYQLTPQDIATLLGENVVWATVAPITVKYHSQAQTENVRIDSLFVDGMDMQADGWFLKWRSLSAPKPKTDYVSVWGRDGDIDLTENESDGKVFYENRNLMMDMVYIGEDWIEAYSELLDMLHGKECMVQFSNDPYWYWAGRIIASLYEHKPHSLAMSGIMFPYKLSVAKVIESATVNGLTESNAVDVVLPGSRMRVSPKVTVTAGSGDSVTLKWGDNTQALSAGTYYVRGLKVGSDDVTIKVYGTGTVNFEYRKGML